MCTQETSTGTEIHKALKDALERVGKVGCDYLYLIVRYSDGVSVTTEVIVQPQRPVEEPDDDYAD